jgi:hypothetical protein
MSSFFAVKLDKRGSLLLLGITKTMAMAINPAARPSTLMRFLIFSSVFRLTITLRRLFWTVLTRYHRIPTDACSAENVRPPDGATMMNWSEACCA